MVWCDDCVWLFTIILFTIVLLEGLCCGLFTMVVLNGLLLGSFTMDLLDGLCLRL